MFKEILEEIAKQTEARTTISDCDYVRDGLLYCGKCNTPKQTVIDVCGKKETVFCLCQCELDRIRKEDAKAAERQRAAKVRDRKRDCFESPRLQKKYSNATFARDDQRYPAVTTAARNYCDSFSRRKRSGEGLLLYGDIGTGKTFMAACIANELIEKGYSVKVTSISLIDGKSIAERQDYIDELDRYSLLIIDDLGVERRSDYVSEIALQVINNRYNLALPLIVTTNLTAEEMRNPKQKNERQAYSRILEICTPIKFSGSDRRIEKARSLYQERKDSLTKGTEGNDNN